MLKNKDKVFLTEAQRAIKDFEKKKISKKKFFLLVARAGKKLSTGYPHFYLTGRKK